MCDCWFKDKYLRDNHANCINTECQFCKRILFVNTLIHFCGEFNGHIDPEYIQKKPNFYKESKNITKFPMIDNRLITNLDVLTEKNKGIKKPRRTRRNLNREIYIKASKITERSKDMIDIEEQLKNIEYSPKIKNFDIEDFYGDDAFNNTIKNKIF
jgi:hypothetical protein